MPMVVRPFPAIDALIPLWTGRLLCFPSAGKPGTISALPRFGLPLILPTDRPEQHDGMCLSALHNGSSITRALIYHVGMRKQILALHLGRHVWGLLPIGHRRISRLDTGDQMRKVRITRFTEMDVVPIPGEISFLAKMGLWIRGGTDGQTCREKSIFVAQAQRPLLPENVVHPDLPQEAHLRELSKVRGGLLLRARGAQS